MTDKQEKVPHIGIAVLWISSIFLFNPAVAVFDPLPDVIGYLLLYIGLAHISAVCPYFERAQKGFSRMLIASAVVLPALLFVRLLAAKSEQDSLLLLLTFVYSTAEWVLAVPAWRALFAATRHNGVGIGRRSLFAGRGKNRKRASRNDSLARYTTFERVGERGGILPLPESVPPLFRHPSSDFRHHMADPDDSIFCPSFKGQRLLPDIG